MEGITIPLSTGWAPATWPPDSDIMYYPTSTKLLFALQGPLLRGVLQDSFELLRATLLVDHAFPDAIIMPLIIRESLLAATEMQNPGAAVIRKRLMDDTEYLTTLICLVSSITLNMIH